MRYFRDKQATSSHFAATSKYTGIQAHAFYNGIFTEWAVSELYGFDHEKNRVVVYGKPNTSVGVTSIPE